eukprot:CAMPEP_0197040504 /NCGR_PEP_ID=MMETSP1384-20130603/17195_1 /TAXON_ID=29189 /ORGANISM="Ammonia sp." /LENGTH=259 /DNA_ID=CAMNT_0042471279 /DNA_START=41 /DNA_END=820 /DNA_ORIENTATION=-
MGEQVSKMYAEVCGGVCPNEAENEEEAKKQEEELKKAKAIKPFVDAVNIIDKELAANTFNIEKYASNKGESMYIYMLRLNKKWQAGDQAVATTAAHTAPDQDARKEEKAEAEDPATAELKAMKAQMDVNKTDPFDVITNGKTGKWKEAGTDYEKKKQIIEEVWDFVLENTDDINKPDKVLEQRTLDIMRRDYNVCTVFEQKVFVYKYCVKVGQDMDKMPTLSNMTDTYIVSTYNALPAQMDDAFILNAKKRGPQQCVIL